MKRHIDTPLEFNGKSSQARLLINRLSRVLGEVEQGATLPSDFVDRLFRWKQLVIEDAPEITHSVEDLARRLANLTGVDLAARQQLAGQALCALTALLEHLPQGGDVSAPSRGLEGERVARHPMVLDSRATSGRRQVASRGSSVQERKRVPAIRKLGDPLRVLGQTPQRYLAALDRLGLHTVEDLLWHLPRRYVDYSRLVPVAQIRPGQEVTIRAVVQHIAANGGIRGSLRRVEARLSDVTGSCTAVWFGQEWRTKQEALQPGSELFVSGKVRFYGGKLQFTHPDFEPVGEDAGIHTGRLVPIYPLSGDLPGAWLRVRVKRALDTCLQQIQENLPEDLLNLAGVLPLRTTLLQVHFPDNTEALTSAQRRIALNRLLPLQIGLLQQRREWQRKEAIPLPLSTEQRLAFQEKLPFILTPGQLRALDEILTDLAASHPMGRLLQGDVGSGKTVVAAMAALAAVENGAQVAVIAPTEILAEQHAATFAKLFAPIHELLRPILLTGRLSVKVRRDMWRLVGSGQARIVVGTQSLLNEEGTFARLALVIVDEQHRFGVYQRDALWRKGIHPHLLAMTATP
ncbi:MAG: DEAD/DEAH box helicase, partial [Chloroflexi bacterium]|nr:DEAD/DEAH box helicase [Chloroflexota bacterium]